MMIALQKNDENLVQYTENNGELGKQKTEKVLIKYKT